MSTPRDPAFGEGSEADVVEQLTPVDASDEDELEPGRVALSPTLDANEADLIEQSLAVPLSDDEPDFDR